MARLVPKSVNEAKWVSLAANRVFVFRSKPDDVIYLRLGKGISFYLEITPTQMGGRIVNSIEYHSGETNLLTKLSDQEALSMGRAEPSTVKIALPNLSRHHVLFVLDGDVVMVKDMGSVNGTFCHADCTYFDIKKYLETHPLDKAAGDTLDSVHEAFGPTLDDFLKKYLQQKEKQYDTDPDIK